MTVIDSGCFYICSLLYLWAFVFPLLSEKGVSIQQSRGRTAVHVGIPPCSCKAGQASSFKNSNVARAATIRVQSQPGPYVCTQVASPSCPSCLCSNTAVFSELAPSKLRRHLCPDCSTDVPNSKVDHFISKKMGFYCQPCKFSGI